MVSRSCPLQSAEELLAHRGPVPEIGLDQSRLVVEAELRRHLVGELRLAVGRKPRELSLVPQHAEAARDRRVAVGAREPGLLQRFREPAIVAVETFERAVLQAAHRIADIVADAVGRIDQRLVPVGVEQRGERVARVVVGEIDLRVRPERIVLQEAVGAEQLVRIGDAEAMAQDRELAMRALFPLPAFERVPELARQRETCSRASETSRAWSRSRRRRCAASPRCAAPRRSRARAPSRPSPSRGSSAPRTPRRPARSRRTRRRTSRACRRGSPRYAKRYLFLCGRVWARGDYHPCRAGGRGGVRAKRSASSVCCPPPCGEGG